MNSIVQTFTIPTRKDVSANNKKYFDHFNERLGMMPNLFAVMAFSEYALESYFQFYSRKHDLNRQEIEIIGLIVATIYECSYCQERHYMAARLNDLNKEDIEEIKQGNATFQPRLHALTRLTHSIVTNRGNVESQLLDDFSLPAIPKHIS
jgi:AhpD family alkylhydroperoxidase